MSFFEFPHTRTYDTDLGWLIRQTKTNEEAITALLCGENLLLVMGIGAAASVLPLIAGLIFAKFIGKKVKSEDETVTSDEVVKTYEELVAGFGKLPGVCPDKTNRAFQFHIGNADSL